MRDDFDQIYRDHPDYFGSEPSPLLERFSDHIPAGSRVLDIGVGQGRHALFLARRGFSVTGIDTSEVAIATLQEVAQREQLPLELWQGNFFDYEPQDIGFGAVLVFGLLQCLRRREGAGLLFRLRQWTRPGGLVFLTAWHVDDPDYTEISQTWTRIGLHSYRNSEGACRTFLARGEIRDLMLGWGFLHFWEGIGPPHRHAEGPVERHGAVELVALRSG